MDPNILTMLIESITFYKKIKKIKIKHIFYFLHHYVLCFLWFFVWYFHFLFVLKNSVMLLFDFAKLSAWRK